MPVNGTQVTSSSLGSHDRKLRYRSLLEDLSSLEDEDDNNVTRMNKTASAVREAQALLAEGGVEERVKHPGEGYLDSRVLRATSDLAVRCSEDVSGNVNTYNKHELAQHIKENPDFWLFALPKEVPSMMSLFGTFAPTPPEQRPRAARRRVQRQRAAALTAPEAVDKLDKVEEGSEMVSRVNRFINKTYRSNGNIPLSYFHVVLDPESFSRSVENIYHVSFLVRDGMVAIDLDEEHELPFITPTPAPQQDQRDITEENQFIVSVDIKQWQVRFITTLKRKVFRQTPFTKHQELIEAFKIRKPMMVLKRH